MKRNTFTPRVKLGLPRVKLGPVETHTVSMSIGRTINLGNYESFRMEITAESGVGDSTPPEVLDRLEKAIVKDLNARIKRNVAALKG